MSSERKRKLGEGEGEQYIMTLLKRLHLERSSELYEKAPLLKSTPPSLSAGSNIAGSNNAGSNSAGCSTGSSAGCSAGSKRWRLSSIVEEDGGAAKRCKIDREMADTLFNNLWISEKETKKTAASERSERSEAGVEPGELPSITLVGVRSGARSLEGVRSGARSLEGVRSGARSLEGVRSGARSLEGVRSGARSLEEDFLRRQLREQSLQVVLWTPPLTVDTIVQHSLHTAHPDRSFRNEDGDSEYMC